MLTRPTLRKVAFDPANYGLEKSQVDWLKEKLPPNPTLDDLFDTTLPISPSSISHVLDMVTICERYRGPTRTAGPERPT